jgi:hypothetical protein
MASDTSSSPSCKDKASSCRGFALSRCWPGPLLTIRDFLMKDSRLGSPGLLAFSFHKNLDDPVSSEIALQYGNEEA